MLDAVRVIIQLFIIVTQVRTPGINIIQRKNTVTVAKLTTIISIKAHTIQMKIPSQISSVLKHAQVQMSVQTTT